MPAAQLTAKAAKNASQSRHAESAGKVGGRDDAEDQHRDRDDEDELGKRVAGSRG